MQKKKHNCARPFPLPFYFCGCGPTPLPMPSPVLSLLEDDAEPDCPLCAEPLDATDLQARLCTACPFQPCLFCYQRLVDQAASDEVATRCPNCRTEYDGHRIDQQRLDPQL